MLKHDLVIRGGLVADGIGGEPFEADVAVHDGKIAEVGKISSAGKEEIDAKGLLVTPGFVDIHTHYDGQAAWSDRINPSSSLGATTVVFGNCGVGFAPCYPADRDLLVSLMEGVEDISTRSACRRPGMELEDVSGIPRRACRAQLRYRGWRAVSPCLFARVRDGRACAEWRSRQRCRHRGNGASYRGSDKRWGGRILYLAQH